MISATDMAAMQATVNASFDQTATLTRPTYTSGAYGQPVENDATIAINATGTAYNCNLATPSANLAQRYAERIKTLKAYRVRLPAGQDIKEQDVLTVTTQNGLQLKVQAVLELNSYSTSVQVLATVYK